MGRLHAPDGLAMTAADLAELKILAFEMKRARERRLMECTGKHAFETRSDAQRAIRQRLRRKAEPFRCTVCSAWHVGGREHARRREKAKQRIRDERSAAW
jgi:hypothetical protein